MADTTTQTTPGALRAPAGRTHHIDSTNGRYYVVADDGTVTPDSEDAATEMRRAGFVPVEDARTAKQKRAADAAAPATTSGQATTVHASTTTVGAPVNVS